MCVHLDGLNADQFRVWVDNTSLIIIIFIFLNRRQNDSMIITVIIVTVIIIVVVCGVGLHTGNGGQVSAVHCGIQYSAV